MIGREKRPLVFPYLNSNLQQLLELCDISRYVSSLNLDKQLLLLNFAVSPGTSAYDFAHPSPHRSAKSPSDPETTWLPKATASLYRDTKNQPKRLTKLRLIEVVLNQLTVHKAKNYKLTVYGVYHIIANIGYLTSVIVKGLLRNYGDHPLFQCFLYPWVKKDTLLSISGDSTLFSQLSLYLLDCSRTVKDTLNYIDRMEDLFIWQDIRTGNRDAKALCDFLAQKFGWTWLGEADIQKSNSKVLELRGTGSHSAVIRLSDDGKKASLSYKGKKEIELPVSIFFSKLMIQRPTQLDETYMKNFIATHSKRVQQLIFSIVSDESIEPDTRRILAQDDTFRKAIQDIKNQFEQRYNQFE